MVSHPLRIGTGQGRPNGTSRNEPFDRWFRYPAGFSRELADQLFGQLEVRPGGLVLDPFVGSGVAATAARDRGCRFIGIEAHPLVAELAATKLNWPGAGSELVVAAEEVEREARKRCGNTLRRRELESETDLVQRSFAPETLMQLVALRETIKQRDSARWGHHLKWAVLGTLRDVANVKVGWPYQLPGKSREAPFNDVFERFEDRCSMIAADIDSVPQRTAECQIVVGDSRSSAVWRHLDVGEASACITSPPYLNNFDYADATRLELYFWGTVATWAEMSEYVRSDLLVSTTQQSSVAEAARALERLRSDNLLLPSISEVLEKLTRERESRPRGKEYDRMVVTYFADIADVFRNLKRVLRPGSRVVMTVGDSAPYGVHIDTPTMLASVATEIGYTLGADVMLRHRGRRWLSNGTRHKVPLSERVLVLSA
ncbi:MAG: DNA methyltransferase [Actinomycetota bacterium]